MIEILFLMLILSNKYYIITNFKYHYKSTTFTIKFGSTSSSFNNTNFGSPTPQLKFVFAKWNTLNIS
jgi:hypothetical protein